MSTLRPDGSRGQERCQSVRLIIRGSPGAPGIGPGELKKPPKPPLDEKKTRCVSFWIRESDYFKLLKMARDNTTMASIARRALKHYLERFRKRGRP
jgi:hypothetical protein